MHITNERSIPRKFSNVSVDAAAVFWIGLRRGWWISIISSILKLVNSKGSDKPSKKKNRKQSQQQQQKKKSKAARAGEDADDEGADESSAAAAAGAVAGGGTAAAAKALFDKLRKKAKGNKTGSTDNFAERESHHHYSEDTQNYNLAHDDGSLWLIKSRRECC